MGSDVTVRPLNFRTDLPRLRALVVAEAESMNIPDGDINQRMDEFLDSAQVPWDVFLIAEVGTAFAGFAVIKTSAKFSASHKGSLRIQVAEPFRTNGVGSALLTAALEWADNERGLVRVEATPYITEPEDALKLAFFARHGFEFEGELRKAARLRDGGYTDVALLARVREEMA